MHRLLRRQLDRYAPGAGERPELERFLGAVSDAYQQMDEDRAMVERSLELTSSELNERNRELARSNEELAKFAYVVSHDLQEPLRSIAGFTSLFIRRHGDSLAPEARELLEGAIGGARRMQAFIRDLLEYSKAGTELANDVVDLDAAMRSVLAALRAAIGSSGADVTVDALPAAMGDRRAVERVLQNLVSNALKFQAGDRPPRIRVRGAVEGGRCRIAVEDNGIGIPDGQYERIFKMFQSAHSREEFPGTGIGLAICAKLVERMGGRIEVSSEVGKGSTFIVDLAGGEGVVA
jgi:light-regulated signal transduction histidine kinase (bacteriophytochrome)